MGTVGGDSYAFPPAQKHHCVLRWESQKDTSRQWHHYDDSCSLPGLSCGIIPDRVVNPKIMQSLCVRLSCKLKRNQLLVSVCQARCAILKWHFCLALDCGLSVISGHGQGMAVVARLHLEREEGGGDLDARHSRNYAAWEASRKDMPGYVLLAWATKQSSYPYWWWLLHHQGNHLSLHGIIQKVWELSQALGSLQG